MRKFAGSFLVGLCIALLLIGLLGYLNYTSTPASMARECRQISIGLNSQSVENRLADYMDDDDVDVNRRGSGIVPSVPPVEYDESLSLYTLSLFDDFQCNVFYRNDEVVHIEVIAD